jgi:hypothetical protein
VIAGDLVNHKGFIAVGTGGVKQPSNCCWPFRSSFIDRGFTLTADIGYRLSGHLNPRIRILREHGHGTTPLTGSQGLNFIFLLAVWPFGADDRRMPNHRIFTAVAGVFGSVHSHNGI